MKTLLFTLEYPPFKGGVASYYGNLVRHFPSPENIFVLHNNENKLIGRWFRPRWLKAVLRLYREIKEKNIGHVLVGHLLPLGIAAYYVTKLTKTPYTIFVHGMDIVYAQKTLRKKRMSRKILGKAAHIICASNYTASLVKEFIGDNGRIRVVNPGAEKDIVRNEDLIAAIRKKHRFFNKIVMYSVGRLVKRKGFDKVVESMPEILRAVPNLYYFIAGDGPDKRYIYEKARGIPNIVFLKKPDDEEKWAWLEACDIFAMVSRNIAGDFEGFGIVYLEANLAGKPVIAGDSGGVRDAVKNAFSGLLVNPENTERIAAAVIRLAQDESLRKQLGEQGRERAINEFNWEKQAGKIYEILNKQR
ncbi:hypothetical protein A2303_06190 [Candidatus Falkowbacteria bacterium RIFOXYB2_FULL_47_14]|uniref:Glycosyl transferase family 1 domain-containing protein n=1 Tax=Candidatus Falkowbacteria bacterium RIFOXYA2_FULL_47_19 TaxID=1797994 RepID=A0A1F5SMM9_9BACT|nr:MAG: hypothetical protein A2227_05205 [Candidatus Falkowbacteria bacterium RIFOXYA2_FULL_47_19]OGF35131.1 MAG: hypothetical protein A2468_04055 [Candidatus Falkowbacteria bacterium RIFOXYC2_FULL_46_15]OGF43151.1 MAG: hypothetical protein A2303_06190 [Candidatus Falkowbacteria bacterium RIFOXYB2_FULL_47_14]